MAVSKERRKAPRKPATPKPDTAMEKTTVKPRAGQSADELRRQIEEAAYYRAKQRGFQPGHELDDWIQAESEVLDRNGLR